MELDTPLSRSIIFGILLTLMIPSVICSLFLLYYFVRSPELLKRHNNHVILALLLISLIQVSHEQLMLKKILFSFCRWPRKCRSPWLCCIRDLWLYNQVCFVTFGLYTIMHCLLMVWCSWLMDVSSDTFLYFVESFSKSIWFYSTTDR